MENNIEVGTNTGPPGISCLTTRTAATDTNGDTFSTALACHPRTNPFKDQLGGFSKDLFKNLANQFGDELQDPKPSGGSEPSGSDHESSQPTGYGEPVNMETPTGEKVCPEIVTEQKIVNGELKDIDFATIHGRCNSDNSNGSNNTGQADGAYEQKTVDPETENKGKDSEGIGAFFEGVIAGDFSDNDSWSATAGKIIGGLNPLADIRDIAAGVTHVVQGKEGSWVELGTSIAGAIPLE